MTVPGKRVMCVCVCKCNITFYIYNIAYLVEQSLRECQFLTTCERVKTSRRIVMLGASELAFVTIRLQELVNEQ